MDLERLNAAAFEGNTAALNRLFQEDPLILDKVSLKYCSDKTTPLPLHTAVVMGHVNFVRAIMIVSSDMCLARDSDGRNPLHLAAIKGRRNILEVLIQSRPLAAREKTDRGETVLHLCVKYCQLEALKMIVEQVKDFGFLNAKNGEGMTVLHLAVLDNQIETVRFLVENEIDVKAKDRNGKTALNICGDVTNTEIRNLLQNSGAAIRTDEKIDDHPKQGHDWLAKKRDAIMVVASLIATMAFQAGVNPPGGVWQDDQISSSSDHNSPPPHRAGEAVMAYSHKRAYRYFLRANTIAFVSSLSTILLLISGLPFRRRLFMWFLMVEMWLTITTIALTYGISIVIVTPKDDRQPLSRVIEIAVIVWCSVMSLLLLGNTIRLINRWLRARRTGKLSPGKSANSPV